MRIRFNLTPPNDHTPSLLAKCGKPEKPNTPLVCHATLAMTVSLELNQPILLKTKIPRLPYNKMIEDFYFEIF